MVIHLAYLIYYLASITALVILDNSSLNPSVLLKKTFFDGLENVSTSTLKRPQYSDYF